LGFPSASAKGFDEGMGRYGSFHGLFLCEPGLIARQKLPLPIASRGGSGNPVKNRAQRPLQFIPL
jgi:hypothetical protein